ncbi:MAG: prepilin-type N-terminal cleavage/methylation domain-containing protein [bacterium]|nr:prepilin-type N-terminal cleavage/methylation domain-containing protein [bacterium]
MQTKTFKNHSLKSACRSAECPKDPRADQRNKGFTLIEILIVVGIIGILSSVILVGLGSSRERARDSRRVTDLRQIQQGLELFYTKNGEYPDGLDDLTSENIGVRQLPTDPSTDEDYEYASCNGGQDYMLKAELDSESPNLTRDSVSDPLCGISCSGSSEFCVAS